MPENCKEKIVSETYVDFLWRSNVSPERLQELFPGICIQPIGSVYSVFYVSQEFLRSTSSLSYPYEAFPALYGLLQTEALEASNILVLQNQPVLQLKGQGVILGFVDTGIDYTNTCFRRPDGTSRILEIWDQTVQSGISPEGIAYGSVYGRNMINQALLNEVPLSIVPTTDELGHGTKMAGIAAGSYEEATGWTGAAPLAEIAVVKVKPAKSYLKQYFAVRPDAVAYQENDIMLGIRYLNDLALREGKPLVICLGIGTNMGGHNGTSPLAGYLNDISTRPGRSVIVAGGNEANQGHHFSGKFEAGQSYQDVEMRVAEEEYGLTLELWSNTPDVLSVSLRSPAGEEIPRIGEGGGNRRFDFVFERTIVYVEFLPLEARSGDQLIVIRMFRPSAGIWNLRVYGERVVDGVYHLWLPISGFLSSETRFLRSDPDITLTEPSNGAGPVTVGAYQAENESLDINSGRGFTRDGRIKPDLTAPGVEVYTYGPGNRFGTLTGTSASSSIAAGAAALILEWAVVRKNRPDISNLEIKQLFIRGASRNDQLEYPNRSWGYGILDLYESFKYLGRF